MKTNYPICDNITRYYILSKKYLENKDIRILNECSSQTATNLIAKIRFWLAKQGISSQSGRVLSRHFIEFMEWDFDFIQTLAQKDMAVIAVRGQTAELSIQ